MKKAAALGLAFCLLLTACGQQKVPSSETEKSSASVESASLNTERINEPSVQETEPAKQSKDLHPEMRLQSAIYTGFIETEDVIYYYNWMKKRIYFSVDNGSHFYPLCSKANCSHSDENCTASGNSLTYFEGSLYTIRFDSEANLFQLVRISPDGTDQWVFRTVPFPGGGSFKYDFHNGKAFIYYHPSLTYPLEEQKTRLFVIDLVSEEMTEPLTELLQYGESIQQFHFFQNTLAVEVSGVNIYTGIEQPRICCIDMNTWNYQEYVQGEYVYANYIDDENLYFYKSSNLLDLSTHPSLKAGFYKINRETGECVCLLETGAYLHAIYDEDYIYATSLHTDKDMQHHTLHIYNRNYELVDQKELNKYEYLVYVSSERLFFSRWYDGGGIYSYAEKSDIGSGDMPIYDVNK